MAQINERSTVPIGWVATMLFTLGGVLIGMTFWVSKVNFNMEQQNGRLSRIEQALGLDTPRIPGSANIAIVNSANAAAKR